jgi:hypothetical protein
VDIGLRPVQAKKIILEPPGMVVTSVILATWEADIRRIVVPDQPKPKVQKTPISINKSWA